MQEVITRRLDFPKDRVWVTTNAFESNGRWMHAIYLHFDKNDFPQLVYPKLNEETKFFKFHDSSFSLMDVHYYVSFYEETTVIRNRKTYVKVGWDFSHLNDEEWQVVDLGKRILVNYAPVVVAEFNKLIGKEVE